MNLSQYQFDSNPLSIVEYKNCIFHGHVGNSIKQNVGILMLDSGEVIIANFLNNHLHGDAFIFLNPKTYVIGSFIRGMLDGKFLLRNQQISVYWTTKMNKIQGQIIVINYQTLNARIWIIQNGEGHCLQQMEIKQTDKQSDILSVISTSFKVYGSAIEFLNEKFSQSLRFQSLSLSQTIRVSLETNSNQRLSFIIFKQKLVEYGLYHQDILNGLGYMTEGLNIFQGRFKNGKIDGFGLKYDKQMSNFFFLMQDKIIYGTFKNGDIRTIDVLTDNEENARKQLKAYKKQQHIFSLDYCNNYFNERPILMLCNFYSTIQQNDKRLTEQVEAQQSVMINTKDRSRQNTTEKEESRFSPSPKSNLNLFMKEKSQNKVLLTSETKTQHYPSRFQKVNKNLGFSEQKSDFSEGINEYNRINKVLRKFK